MSLPVLRSLPGPAALASISSGASLEFGAVEKEVVDSVCNFEQTPAGD
jgi:hypothetical protein